MNRKSIRLKYRAAPPKIVAMENDVDLERQTCDSDSVQVGENMVVVGHDVVGGESTNIVPVDIDVETGLVTVSDSTDTAVVAEAVVDVVAEDQLPLVRGGYDVVGADDTVVGGGEEGDMADMEINDKRGRKKTAKEDMAERYYHHYH